MIGKCKGCSQTGQYVNNKGLCYTCRNKMPGATPEKLRAAEDENRRRREQDDDDDDRRRRDEDERRRRDNNDAAMQAAMMAAWIAIM